MLLYNIKVNVNDYSSHFPYRKIMKRMDSSRNTTSVLRKLYDVFITDNHGKHFVAGLKRFFTLMWTTVVAVKCQHLYFQILYVH